MAKKSPPPSGYSQDEKLHLRLLTGPAGSGKTHACLVELTRAIRSSEDALAEDLLFILPTVEHRERTTDLLLRGGLPGFFRRKVTTFDEALRSFLTLGGIHFASDVTRELLLKELIGRTEFGYFKEAAATRGFVTLIARFFAELKESLVTTDDLSRWPDALEKKFPHAGTKYRELSALYDAYEKELKQVNLKDKHDALFLLEEGLKRGEWKLPKFRRIWIDGFFDFSRLQLAFIRFLAPHTDHMTVTLTLDSEGARAGLFDIAFQTKRLLTDIGFKTIALPAVNARAKSQPLVHAERYLFQEKETAKIPCTDAIRIFEAAGLTGELEMIARDIKRIVRETGIYFSDIALIFRRVGSYVPVIRSVFSAYGIPVEFHEREELRLNPLARTMMSVLRLMTDDWKREDLLNCLKSGYLRAESGRIHEMEMRAVRSGILKGRHEWLKHFELPVLKTLSDLHDTLLRVETVDQFVRFIRETLRALGMNALPLDLSEKTRLDHAAMKRLHLLLLEMQRKYSEVKLGPDKFADRLIRLIEVDLFSFHNRDKNKIQVYNISLARQKEYKVVFLPGLLEKQFPLQMKEDPIFSDAERREVNQASEILRERLPRQSIERFLFYLGVTRATEQLVLSYPRFDLEGREALPSFYVDEVKTIFDGEIPVQKQPAGDALPKLADLATSHDAAARVIRDVWQALPQKSAARETEPVIFIYNELIGHEPFRRLIRSLTAPIEGKITDERIRTLFQPKDGIFTPSRLEIYSECPYRYFASQLLRLEGDDEAIDPRVIGTILHQVLQDFHEWAKPQGLGRVSIESARAMCETLFHKELDRNPILGDRRYRIELKKREMLDTLFGILDQELVKKKPPLPGLKPEYFEYEFGGEEKRDYLILESEEGAVKFRGKIDRIDVDPSGKFGLVIDYKTGKKFSGKSLARKTQLQLPLYLLAAKQNLGLEPLGGHLYSLSAASSTGFHHREHLDQLGITTGKRNKKTAKEWESLFEELARFILKYVREIQKAEIPVRPRDCVHFCAYADLCRIEKWRLDDIYRGIQEEDKKFMNETEPISGKAGPS